MRNREKVVVDVSVRYANRRAHPVGISRVETELIRASLAQPADQFSYCRFDAGLGGYVPVPRSIAADLASSTPVQSCIDDSKSAPAIECTTDHPFGDAQPDEHGARAAWVGGRFDDGWLESGALLYVDRTDTIAVALYLPVAPDKAEATKSIVVSVQGGCQMRLAVPRGQVSWSPPIPVSPDGTFVQFLSDDLEPITEVDRRELAVICTAVRSPSQVLAGADLQNDTHENTAQLLGELAIPYGASVLVASAPWNDDSLQWLARERERRALRVHAIIYDIVPLVIPEHCLPGMREKFERMILEAARISEGLYCISDYTRDDLRRFLQDDAAPVPPLHRIRLGDTLHHSAQDVGAPSALGDLKPGKFILCVGTIEPRKNHAMLFRVWRRMIDHAPQDVLPIVFVGRNGWGTHDLLQMIALNPRLSTALIRIAHDAPDGQLRWLYKNCRFTVYPSYYEGWGLPVAESLACGKLCLASDTSSMPEAGQGLAEFIDPDDFFGWYDNIRHFATSDADLAAREAEIRACYKAQDWGTTFDQLLAEAMGLRTVDSSYCGSTG